MAKQADKNNTELAPVTSTYLALAGEGSSSALAMIRENLGGEQLGPGDLQHLNVPGSGGQFWTVATAEHPEGEPRRSIIGIILGSMAQRAYYKTLFKDSGGGSPPDCYSHDQIVGTGDPGGDCMTCPLAQFGSAQGEGGGQACGAFRSVFLLTPESPLPVIMKVPTMSLKAFKKFLIGLGSATLRPIQVESEFSIVVTKSKQRGLDVATIAPRVVRRLADDEVAKVSAYAEAIAPHLQRVARQAATEPQTGI